MKKRFAALLLIAGLVSSLSSFTTPFGGEGFQIYIDNKLVVERFGPKMSEVQTLKLEEFAPNAKLTVKYWHCNQVGKDRAITLKDADQKVLKQYKYKDATEKLSAMNCNLYDIALLQKSTKLINLYYASDEAPQGRLLVTIDVNRALAKK
ncbi:MAG: hypothetical protein H7Y31_17580 [Chitinophagaceae bacterium]|nr:hypothetical protein [Chitinophagaceae bacterium]